jgi:hypothetical protein
MTRGVLPFGVTAVEFGLVTFVSALVGISLVIGASRFLRTRYLAAFALGVYLWYFTDTLGDANYLGVNGGFTLNTELVSLVLLFIVGLFVFFALDKRIFTTGEAAGYGALAVGALAALALGFHGFGEGADFGFTAAQTPSNSLFDAFGGLLPSASWVLHKMAEPTIAAVAYVAVTGPGSKKATVKVVDALILSTVFVIPAVIGSVAGYYTTFDHTYVFALGLGTSVYALARVGRALYAPGEGAESWLSLKMALAAVLGFLLIFMAALLH